MRRVAGLAWCGLCPTGLCWCLWSNVCSFGSWWRCFGVRFGALVCWRFVHSFHLLQLMIHWHFPRYSRMLLRSPVGVRFRRNLPIRFVRSIVVLDLGAVGCWWGRGLSCSLCVVVLVVLWMCFVLVELHCCVCQPLFVLVCVCLGLLSAWCGSTVFLGSV